MRREQLREELAALEHDRWSRWMKYLTEHAHLSTTENVGRFGESLAFRWYRLMETPYADLSEAEKESDRAEADRTLALLDRVGALAEYRRLQEEHNLLLAFRDVVIRQMSKRSACYGDYWGLEAKIEEALDAVIDIRPTEGAPR